MKLKKIDARMSNNINIVNRLNSDIRSSDILVKILSQAI